MLLTLLVIVAIAAAGGFVASRRATRLRGQGQGLHSLPFYHGMLVALWTAIPAIAPMPQACNSSRRDAISGASAVTR